MELVLGIATAFLVLCGLEVAGRTSATEETPTSMTQLVARMDVAEPGEPSEEDAERPSA
jgi:hypothetical protein